MRLSVAETRTALTFWGAPQLGHITADSCNSLPHPLQKTIAMLSLALAAKSQALFAPADRMQRSQARISAKGFSPRFFLCAVADILRATRPNYKPKSPQGSISPDFRDRLQQRSRCSSSSTNRPISQPAWLCRDYCRFSNNTTIINLYVTPARTLQLRSG